MQVSRWLALCCARLSSHLTSSLPSCVGWQLILDLADDFVEDVANFACRLAKHRHSNTLDVQDLQMHLSEATSAQRHRRRVTTMRLLLLTPRSCLALLPRFSVKNWQISIPGFSVPEPLLSAPSVGPSSGPSSTLGSSTGLHVRNILTPSYGIGEAHRKRMALVAKVKTKEAKKVAASMQAVAAATNTGAVAEEANGAANGSTAPKPNAAAAAQQKKRKRPNEE